MRIAIRADASTTIGTGHVMRQIALAQHLLGENHEVRLFASITGPDWLRKYVESQSGLDWLEVEEGDFSADPLLAGGALDALVVDAYTLDEKALQLLEKAIPTVAVFVDGPWQNVSGKMAIAPTLDGNPAWVSGYRKRFEEFHWGPEFFMIRREVIELRKKRSRRSPDSEPRIVVALGGSDLGGHTGTVLSALSETGKAAKIDVFAPAPGIWGNFRANGGHFVEFHEPGPAFLEYLGNADLAVTAAGTMAAEISFLGVEAIFIPVAPNQQENALALRALKLGVVLNLDEADFPEQLVESVQKSFLSPTVNPRHLITSKGAQRVADILISSRLSNGKM